MSKNIFGIDDPKVYIVNSDSMRKNKDVVIYYRTKDFCKVMSIENAEEELLRQEVLNDLVLFIDEKMYEEMKTILSISEKEVATKVPSFSEILELFAPKPIEKSIPEQIKDVKKKLKYCRNYMEKKTLENELSALYKLKKRKQHE